MSRIGQKPIDVPEGIEVHLSGGTISLKGPKGELEHEVPDGIGLEYDAGARRVLVTRRSDLRRLRAFHGLHRSLIANAVEGVSRGFEKKLELYGTGYSARLRGDSLALQVGFCHEVVVDVPEGVVFQVEQETAQSDRPARFSVTGISKELVGQVAARIRAVRPPEPYKGKGIRYTGEYVRRKEGKAFTGVTG